MRISEKWLREWVNPSASVEQVADQLLMGGLELEIEPAVAASSTGVVVGRIAAIEPHPDADRLRVCQVEVGGGQTSQIVCGAANARVDLRAPCALPGAELANGLKIGVSKLRGVESAGMLCSANELGLAEKSDGLLELDADARIGQPIEQYLGLDDRILNLELTPNRGDCLSVQGLAREVAALFDVQLTRAQRLKPAVVVGHARIGASVEDATDCPVYAGRVINGVKADVRTPDAMQERLRRSGIRCISPLVDITNYVMLELGQPLHAFDADQLKGEIRVRRAQEGERLQLLNDDVVNLSPRELVITDEAGPIALAGVMGGAPTGVSEKSSRVFLESACFSMAAVAGTARRHKINSDAAYRFERGVDPQLQRIALDRATELVIKLCGGEPGPITYVGRPHGEPIRVPLRHARLQALLGIEIPAREVESLLSRLGITLRAEVDGTWTADVPSNRSDIRIEADLIEEVARLYGYDRIPTRPYAAHLAPGAAQEAQRDLYSTKWLLASRGWQEVVNLAFVDRNLQKQLEPKYEAIAVDNPIAENLAVMRTNLWCGLIQSWQHNQARQMNRVRLFEAGVCFSRQNGAICEQNRIAGLAAGSARPEQWGIKAREADFYDLKAEVEALVGHAQPLRYEAGGHPALHPGQSARILRNGHHAGWLGALHPQLTRTLGLSQAPLLFELDWAVVRQDRLPRAQAVSEFPQSRRDLALVVPAAVNAQALCDVARQSGSSALQEVFAFDVYQDRSLGNGGKSIALALIFQDHCRTLTVEEVDAAVDSIVQQLSRQLGAEQRR